MSVKLSKLIKDLNVGISTIAEFLNKKGFTGDFENPNTRLSDEQLGLLYKEFSKDKNQSIESDKMMKQYKEKEKVKSVKLESYETKPAEEITRLHQTFKPLGKIDLNEAGKSSLHIRPIDDEPQTTVNDNNSVQAGAGKQNEEVTASTVQETVQVVEETSPEPENPQQQPSVSEDAQETASEAVPVTEEPETETGDTAAGPEIFRTPGQGNAPAELKVLGKIDLNKINSMTRPPKKSKEEKRRQREEKFGQKSSQQQNNGQQGGQQQGGNSGEKRKRERINREKININKVDGQGKSGKNGQGKKTAKVFGQHAQPSDEDVSKQVKETLAQLQSKKQKNTNFKKERREKERQRRLESEEREEQESKTIKITEFVTVNELATMMNVPVGDVIVTCMNLGEMVSINQRLDAETINIVADEFGYKTEYISAEVLENIHEQEDKEEDLVPRAPIVTVMGHVDHGKTSLLDYIRKSNVIAGEAGGITQHIGAYNVTLENGQHITFLDTPGHEAFTAMRARGAKVTDIAIIIVAADDDVMPQTIEAINHASAAGVPIVFAINKIDKPNANPDHIKQELANMNYLVEDWGGKYQSQDISAKKGIGVKELLEKVLLEAELLDLKANPDKLAVGSIIESSLDKGRGYLATILVEGGTLHQGDVMVAGTSYGKIKAMFNERNQRIKEVRPGEPALILGLNGAPTAGDRFNVLETEQEAREIANKREQLQREQSIRTSKHVTLEELGRRIALGNFKEINVIVKGDVDGSIEALSDSLINLSTPEIQVNVIHKAVGEISESDIMLAAASNAIVIGFQVRPSQAARRLAEREEIDIRLYSIIYDAIEELKSAMEGMLSPEIKEEITATLEILQVFKISKVGSVAGCLVREGKIKRTNKVRLIRDGIVIYTGELGSLRRVKDDVKEVSAGLECGLNIAGYNDIKTGDLIESFEEIEVKKTL